MFIQLASHLVRLWGMELSGINAGGEGWGEKGSRHRGALWEAGSVGVPTLEPCRGREHHSRIRICAEDTMKGDEHV